MLRKLLAITALLVILPAGASAHSHRTGGTIPPTIPIPEQFDGFTVLLHAKGEGCNQNNPCGPEDVLWTAKYQTVVPYYTQRLVSWLGGDREGYRCGYMFIGIDSNGDGDVTDPGEFIGRATFVAVSAPQGATGKYAIVKDDEMGEGDFYFGGSPTPEGTVHTEPGECPNTNPAFYDAPLGPDQRPRVVFRKGANVVEIRDYRPTQVIEGLTFNVVEVITTPFQITVPSGTSTVNQRVTLIAEWLDESIEGGVVRVVVYYDSINTGTVAVDFPT